MTVLYKKKPLNQPHQSADASEIQELTADSLEAPVVNNILPRFSFSPSSDQKSCIDLTNPPLAVEDCVAASRPIVSIAESFNNDESIAAVSDNSTSSMQTCAPMMTRKKSLVAIKYKKRRPALSSL